MRGKRAKQLKRIAKEKNLAPRMYRRMKKEWTKLSVIEKEKAL